MHSTFYQNQFNIRGVMVILRNSTNSRIFFFRLMFSERNLGTLVKENRLPFLSESCSASPKLLALRFLLRLNKYS